MKSTAAKTGSALSPSLTIAHGKPKVQPKLMVNAPGDRYEQEADAMADRVMRMPQSDNAPSVSGLIGRSVQMKCAECEVAEKKKKDTVVQRKESTGMISRSPVSSNGVVSRSIQRCAQCDEARKKNEGTIMRKESSDGSFSAPAGLESRLQYSGGGRSLSANTSQEMNNAFQSDFSRVRVHTDGDAAQMSQEINAKAFTYGSDIYFNHGQYAPHSSEGKRLLAHELTHTLQQQALSDQTYVQRDSDNVRGDMGEGVGTGSESDPADYEWTQLRETQSTAILSKQKNVSIYEDIQKTADIYKAQRAQLFEAVQNVELMDWMDVPVLEENSKFWMPTYKEHQESAKKKTIAPADLIDNYAIADATTVFFSKYSEKMQKDYFDNLSPANSENFEQADMQLPPDFLSDMLEDRFSSYYRSLKIMALNFEKGNNQYEQWSTEMNDVLKKPVTRCNNDCHQMEYISKNTYKAPPATSPYIDSLMIHMENASTLADWDQVVTKDFGSATGLMDTLFGDILGQSGPAVQGRDYIQAILNRQKELMDTQPNAMRIPAVFYPYEEYDDVSKDQGKTKAKEIDWLFYLYNTAFKGFEETGNAEGKWVLEDLTSPQEHKSNKLSNEQSVGALLQQGWIVDPPMELFEQLDSILRFPKGYLYWNMPSGKIQSVETHATETLSQVLTGLGIVLAVIGLTILTAGALAPELAVGAASALSYLGIATAAVGIGATLANWSEKDEQGMLTEGDKKRAYLSLAADLVSAMTGGLGKIVAIAGEASELASLAGKLIVPLEVAGKGLGYANMAVFGYDFLNQWQAIELSGLTPDEIEEAHADLLKSAAIMASFTIIPHVLQHFSTARMPKGVILDVNENHEPVLRESSEAGHLDPNRQLVDIEEEIPKEISANAKKIRPSSDPNYLLEIPIGEKKYWRLNAEGQWCRIASPAQCYIGPEIKELIGKETNAHIVASKIYGLYYNKLIGEETADGLYSLCARAMANDKYAIAELLTLLRKVKQPGIYIEILQQRQGKGNKTPDMIELDRNKGTRSRLEQTTFTKGEPKGLNNDEMTKSYAQSLEHKIRSKVAHGQLTEKIAGRERIRQKGTLVVEIAQLPDGVSFEVVADMAVHRLKTRELETKIEYDRTIRGEQGKAVESIELSYMGQIRKYNRNTGSNFFSYAAEK